MGMRCVFTEIGPVRIVLAVKTSGSFHIRDTLLLHLGLLAA
jgi:hypothetical protein